MAQKVDTAEYAESGRIGRGRRRRCRLSGFSSRASAAAEADQDEMAILESVSGMRVMILKNFQLRIKIKNLRKNQLNFELFNEFR